MERKKGFNGFWGNGIIGRGESEANVVKEGYAWVILREQ